MSDPVAFTQDDINVRLSVSLSLSIEAGLYDGPVTQAVVAGLVAAQLGIEAFDVANMIDSITIEAVGLDDGTELASAS